MQTGAKCFFVCVDQNVTREEEEEEREGGEEGGRGESSRYWKGRVGCVRVCVCVCEVSR